MNKIMWYLYGLFVFLNKKASSPIHVDLDDKVNSFLMSP